jgi:glycosyltransferase involved in cell wall biosynthesis
MLTIAGMAHAPDGSGYYRFYLPFRWLADKSEHMCGMPPIGQQWAPSDAELSQIDVLAMQRPAGKPGVRQMEQLQGKAALVYETDDDMLQVDPSGLPHLYDEKMRGTIRRCIRLADMVTVSTPYLAEQVEQYNDNVVVLQNHINGELISESERWQKELPEDRPLTVGWQGGTSHLMDMVTVADPLRRVLEDNPAVQMHFAGFDYSPLVKRTCRWSTWQQDVWDHYKGTSHFDIAIAPLADHPFNRSKSHLKALEAAAMGIPIVASDSLPYRDFVVDGVTGFLVKSEDEWYTQIDALIHDADMRAEMGAKGREVARGWTMQDTGWRLWESAYESVGG